MATPYQSCYQYKTIIQTWRNTFEWEGGGRSVLYLTGLWPGAIWSKKGRFSWECLNIFAIGCSYSMHCSWWQAVKMTFFAHCPSVSLSAGMSALTGLPTTHCNQFFFVYFILFFLLVYTAEAFLKIVGYGLRKYLLSGWNM